MVNHKLNTGPAIPSQSKLREALTFIGSVLDEGPLRSSSLARIMRENFGGSDAAGAWDWRLAYDTMQAAAVLRVVQGNGQDAPTSAKLLASRLLTETRRSEQQIRLQQFSTPLPYAARLLALRPYGLVRPSSNPRLAPVR